MQTLRKDGVQVVFPESRLEPVGHTENFPYKYVCRLQITFPNASGHGTGTLIGPKYVLTAAHNILNDSHGKAVEIVVSPAQNGHVHPFGSYKMVRAFIPEDYRTKPAPYPIDGGVVDYSRFLYDYALIELDKPVFEENPVQPYVATSQQIRHGDGIIIGYPGGKTAGTMWYAGQTVNVDPDDGPFLFYRISTEPGDSGAAVLKDIDHATRIAGVHVAGSAALESNFGVRITEEVNDQIREWMES